MCPTPPRHRSGVTDCPFWRTYAGRCRLGSGAFVEEEVAEVRVLELDPIGEILGDEVCGRSVRRFCFVVALSDAYRRKTPVIEQDQAVAHEAGLRPEDREHPAPSRSLLSSRRCLVRSGSMPSHRRRGDEVLHGSPLVGSRGGREYDQDGADPGGELENEVYLRSVPHLLLGVLRCFLVFAILGHFLEGIGVIRCGCTPKCWCRRPELRLFRWLVPGATTFRGPGRCCSRIEGQTLGTRPPDAHSRPRHARPELAGRHVSPRGQRSPGDPSGERDVGARLDRRLTQQLVATEQRHGVHTQ